MVRLYRVNSNGHQLQQVLQLCLMVRGFLHRPKRASALIRGSYDPDNIARPDFTARDDHGHRCAGHVRIAVTLRGHRFLQSLSKA